MLTCQIHDILDGHQLVSLVHSCFVLASMSIRVLTGQQLTGILFFLVVFIKSGSGNFHPGDFVQTSRRGQFHGQRTHWHDLLGRHCPKFGEYNVIALPIPKPIGKLGIH